MNAFLRHHIQELRTFKNGPLFFGPPCTYLLVLSGKPRLEFLNGTNRCWLLLYIVIINIIRQPDTSSLRPDSWRSNTKSLGIGTFMQHMKNATDQELQTSMTSSAVYFYLHFSTISTFGHIFAVVTLTLSGKFRTSASQLSELHIYIHHHHHFFKESVYTHG